MLIRGGVQRCGGLINKGSACICFLSAKVKSRWKNFGLRGGGGWHTVRRQSLADRECQQQSVRPRRALELINRSAFLLELIAYVACWVGYYKLINKGFTTLVWYVTGRYRYTSRLF